MKQETVMQETNEIPIDTKNSNISNTPRNIASKEANRDNQESEYLFVQDMITMDTLNYKNEIRLSKNNLIRECIFNKSHYALTEKLKKKEALKRELNKLQMVKFHMEQTKPFKFQPCLVKK